MDLATGKAVDELLSSMSRRRHVRKAGKNSPTRANLESTVSANEAECKTPPVRKSSRCDSGKCETCARCLDNAKWDRVFNEKFADPNYYKGSQTRKGSSLSWL